MTIIYLVSHGSYSDYQIEAAFSTAANAQAFIDSTSWSWGSPRIEAYPVDKWQPNTDRHYWKVTFSPEDETPIGQPIPASTWTVELTPDLTDPNDIPLHTVTNGIIWESIVIAPDEAAAIKIAAERVAQAKAQQAGL
jgi:hypothetical protein